MTYRAPWDNLAKIVTVMTTVLFSAMFFVPFFSTDSFNVPSQMILGGFLLGVYFGCYAFRPVSYTLDQTGITVNRPVKDVNISLGEVSEVELLDDKKLKFTIRTFGVGGLFGYFGKFANSAIGSMTWYATRRRMAVLVKTVAGKRIILTPDEPDDFVSTLKKYLGQ